MASTPEDRGPDSVRVSNYDPSNPIHAGIVRTAGVNSHIEQPHRNDAKKTIVMPVAKGMEAEPKLSGRHMTNEEHENYVLPAEHRVKLPQPAEKKAKVVPKKPSRIRETAAPKKGGYSAYLASLNKPKQ